MRDMGDNFPLIRDLFRKMFISSSPRTVYCLFVLCLFLKVMGQNLDIVHPYLFCKKKSLSFSSHERTVSEAITQTWAVYSTDFSFAIPILTEKSH